MNQLHWIDETPVIMISSEGSVDAMRKAYEMGITDYITRPFDSVIVKKRVQNTLELYANQKRLINVVVDQVYEKEENSSIMIGILSNVLGFRNSESSEHIFTYSYSNGNDVEKVGKNNGCLSSDRDGYCYDHNGILPS